jgi:hypothetical protein
MQPSPPCRCLHQGEHQHDDHHCRQQQQPSLTKPMPPPRRAAARQSPLQPAAATIAHQADVSTNESTSTTTTTAACSSNHRSPSRCLHQGEHQHDDHHCSLQHQPSLTKQMPPPRVLAFSNPWDSLAFSRGVNPRDGPLEFSLLYAISFLRLSPPATDPISKLAKPLLPLQLSLVPSEGPLISA